MYGHSQAVADMTVIFEEPISTYTRAQALDDGVLVDVSAIAAEAGFKWPVAVTRAAWEHCVAWGEADSKRQVYQDEAGRLWDVAFMASQAARWGRERFQLYRVPRGGRGVRPRLVTLQMHCGPGDEGEPVVTIMLQGEN